MKDAIEAEAIAQHEQTLRERGWMDEYEAETAVAMSHGDGIAEERERLRAAVEGLPNPYPPTVAGRSSFGHAGYERHRAAVLALLQPPATTGSEPT